MAKNKASLPVWLRRLTQTAFFLLFLYLFIQTAFHPINTTGGPVGLFFELDPLVLLTVWIATHAIASALLLSLVTVVFTLLFGRWFCGWVCPFGALHNFLTSLRATRLKEKLKTGAYSAWQKSKYYLLAALLVGAFVGPNLTGWFDPFSFFYRSLATVVFPAVNSGLQSIFGWLYEVNPGFGKIRVTAVSEPVYQVLRNYFLAVEQPHYWGTALLGTLFGIIIALNFFRARFWCKYVCPLGALLGVIGKNPILRLKTNLDLCNNCRLCVADCQGGANPHGEDSWKPSECFFCWNCHSDCPSNAISFKFEVPEVTKR